MSYSLAANFWHVSVPQWLYRWMCVGSIHGIGDELPIKADRLSIGPVVAEI